MIQSGKREGEREGEGVCVYDLFVDLKMNSRFSEQYMQYLIEERCSVL
jgi:hypothetical protein